MPSIFFSLSLINSLYKARERVLRTVGKANIDYLVADIDFSTMSNEIFNNVRVTSARSPQQRGYMKISVRIDVSSSCQQHHHRWRPTLIRRPHKCSPPSLKIECFIACYITVRYFLTVVKYVIHRMERNSFISTKWPYFLECNSVIPVLLGSIFGPGYGHSWGHCIKGDLTMSLCSRSAPCSSNSRHTSVWPSLAAQSNAVQLSWKY